MNARTICPAADKLREYLLGQLPEESAALEQHLRACPECQKRLPSIPAEDDFVLGFRAQAGRQEQPSSQIDDLMKRLRGLVQILPIRSDATPVRLPLLETTEELSLLPGAAQQSDEIGRIGGYRILGELGRGGMGVVYRAEDLKLKRIVALKVMRVALAGDLAACRRFLREAQAMAAVHHDHIATIFQVDDDKGVPFLAMQFLHGTTMEKWLKENHKPTTAQILRIGREIADGLAAAHQRGLIHRDIKPSNIWLDSDHAGRVKILDFGLAHAGTDDLHLTGSGTIVGTPAYMAPEQARAEKVDVRTDLFSLGCVLYRLCTGRTPFTGDTTMSLLTSLAVSQPKPMRDFNPQIPPELSTLVMNLLEKDPARRPASALEVMQRIQRMESRLTFNQYADDPTTTLPRAAPILTTVRRRRPWLVVAGALLLGGLIAGAAALIRIQTPEGDYVIDADDPDFSFQVHDGAVKLEDRKNNKTYSLKVVKQDKDAKEVEMQVGDGGDLSFRTKTLTIKRGEKAAVTTWFEPKTTAVAPSVAKPDDAWVRKIAALSAEKQVEAVAAELEKRNRGFDRKVIPVIQDGVVTRLDFSTDRVTDLAPIRALTGLRTLSLSLPVGDGDWTRGRAADLSPLRGLKLTALYLEGTQVSNLSPLQGMPLKALNLSNTNVSDLAPLMGAPLEDFNCAWTPISDLSPLKGAPLTNVFLFGSKISNLSPLKGMKLRRLNCGFTEVGDLAPLEGMPLKGLGCDSTHVSDLSPLRGIQLTYLSINATRVSTLSPVKGAPLTDLYFRRTRVSDLSPLKEMPLQLLECDFDAERDAALLRAIPTLKQINNQPAAEFLKNPDDKKSNK